MWAHGGMHLGDTARDSDSCEFKPKVMVPVYIYWKTEALFCDFPVKNAMSHNL